MVVDAVITIGNAERLNTLGKNKSSLLKDFVLDSWSPKLISLFIHWTKTANFVSGVAAYFLSGKEHGILCLNIKAEAGILSRARNPTINFVLGIQGILVPFDDGRGKYNVFGHDVIPTLLPPLMAAVNMIR
ncbi:hypothetical protein Tco_1251926 [Tanacetum coccineum]